MNHQSKIIKSFEKINHSEIIRKCFTTSARLFIITIVCLLLVQFVLAEKYEENIFKLGLIDNDGELIITDESINDVNVLGIVCQLQFCEEVGERLWGGEILNSLNDNIKLAFPEEMIFPPYGYGVYMFKEGYIPYEINLDIEGEDLGSDLGPYESYLSKKEYCNSKIKNFEAILNDDEITISADILSPIFFDGPLESFIEDSDRNNVIKNDYDFPYNRPGSLDYIPEELEEYYETEVFVEAILYKNGEENIRYYGPKTIGFSEQEEVEYTFFTAGEGEYKVELRTSNENEEYCLNSVTETKDANFSIEEDECNLECYEDDCPEDYYTNNYCYQGDVYIDFHDFYCDWCGECEEIILPELVEDCSYGCNEGECKEEVIECKENSDCDDEVDLTYDECNNPDTVNSYCTNTPVNCVRDSDCGPTGYVGSKYCSVYGDVYQDYRESICIAPATTESYCQIFITPQVVEDCKDDYSTGEICSEGNVVNEFHDISCFDATCIDEITSEVIEECEHGCDDNTNMCVLACVEDSDCGVDYYGAEYCHENGKDVYKDLHDFLCKTNGDCFEGIMPEFVKHCEYGCFEGQCLNQCVLDSDCKDDYYGSKYCKEDNVVRDYYDFNCLNGKCEVSISEDHIEECDEDCEDGKCTEDAGNGRYDRSRDYDTFYNDCSIGFEEECVGQDFLYDIDETYDNFEDYSQIYYEHEFDEQTGIFSVSSEEIEFLGKKNLMVLSDEKVEFSFGVILLYVLFVLILFLLILIVISYLR